MSCRTTRVQGKLSFKLLLRCFLRHKVLRKVSECILRGSECKQPASQASRKKGSGEIILGYRQIHRGRAQFTSYPVKNKDNHHHTTENYINYNKRDQARAFTTVLLFDSARRPGFVTASRGPRRRFEDDVRSAPLQPESIREHTRDYRTCDEDAEVIRRHPEEHWMFFKDAKTHILAFVTSRLGHLTAELQERFLHSDSSTGRAAHVGAAAH
ncbi:hypothetical protein EYF80_003552 [Liparis tanakae]|uniref:Uncharacterized protein n=1 Tax=Liparis tanakae TaxID=230148 RepID=A0A4Z2J6Z1_9TELE|nr:hypothetical protein EYF80_003552 [Liparis tanakae]